jgi:hypothetical protein
LGVKPPQGRARWTLELSAGEMVRLTAHDNVSREKVRRRLPGTFVRKTPQTNGARVTAMSVIDVGELRADVSKTRQRRRTFGDHLRHLTGHAGTIPLARDEAGRRLICLTLRTVPQPFLLLRPGQSSDEEVSFVACAEHATVMLSPVEGIFGSHC